MNRTLVIAVLTLSLVAGCGNSKRSGLQPRTAELLKLVTETEERIGGTLGSVSKIKELATADRIPETDDMRNEGRLALAELKSIRREINRHSDVDKPRIDQIHHEEINHAELTDRVNRANERFREAVDEVGKRPGAKSSRQ